jgi:hypothetical protein
MDDRGRGYDFRAVLRQDVLDVASERIWCEIRGLLPRHRFLLELGRRRNAEQGTELREVSARLVKLRRRSARYRDVLRSEAWARWRDDEAS